MSEITPDDLLGGQVILVNKPPNWTSFDVVNKMRIDIRHEFKIPFAKIGHAGTLDPLASGLLIICIGRQTKNIEQYQGLEKEYTGTIMLGATTPSYDLETPVKERYSIAHITTELIKETAQKFVGAILQYPPDFSAKRVQGNRAYNIARSGGRPDIKPALVTISQFEIVNVLLPMVEFKVICAKGTYIRSLAHDFGKELGCGGLLASLCRTRIGKYKLKDSKEIKNWKESLLPSIPHELIPVKTTVKKTRERVEKSIQMASSVNVQSVLSEKPLKMKRKITVKKKSRPTKKAKSKKKM
jgi:tRNA pseudouridine55 synthase